MGVDDSVKRAPKFEQVTYWNSGSVRHLTCVGHVMGRQMARFGSGPFLPTMGQGGGRKYTTAGI